MAELAQEGAHAYGRILVALVIAALISLALPTTVPAAEYTVDSKADQADLDPNDGICETALGTCTLRAAIEEANQPEGTPDKVVFSSLFNGELTDNIIAGETEFPRIDDALEIDGQASGQCMTAAGIEGPCVGLRLNLKANGLVAFAKNVTIKGLAITSSNENDSLLRVIPVAENFRAQGNWLGVSLAGDVDPMAEGIELTPGSEVATIGGTSPEDRNVIAGAKKAGLAIRGASTSIIKGNYFGVLPDGVTPAPNAIDIAVADWDRYAIPGIDQANQIGIGGKITASGLATPACDRSCNVIADGTVGIDLQGDPSDDHQLPVSGSVTVFGNYIGFDATGAPLASDTRRYGIYAGEAEWVFVGNDEPGTGNFFSGGLYGFYGEGGAVWRVEGNGFGLGPAGSPVPPPAVAAVAACCGAIVNGNAIRGSATGIRLRGSESVVEANSIQETLANGILVEGDDNLVAGNEIVGAGGAGVRIQGPAPGLPASGNFIGGEEIDAENEITESGGAAIQVDGLEASPNEVARNHGSGNGGPFIDLVGGANEGIAPPVISAFQSKAEGTATPGALVRVFRKASAEGGELSSFLAQAEADVSGKWKATYASLPVGTILAATQTKTTGATSELATTSAAADPSGGGGDKKGGGTGGETGGGGGGSNPTPKDLTPPDTKITKAPPKKTTKTTVQFKFTATEAGSSFQCKLDGKPFKPCRSPKTYKSLEPGKHLFKVRAVDAVGNVDPTPAKRTFTID
ncbi:MAG TPA: right-handed parallel beta-helix repeat-containing protein [Solirubrobacterales bacterium]|nr:right-handed parallel beta-helix repeat-containing protein [Solirubrobacterales bacterium]